MRSSAASDGYKRDGWWMVYDGWMDEWMVDGWMDGGWVSEKWMGGDKDGERMVGGWMVEGER